ncbi:MAG: protein phosphatase 2C domain-containing protein [Oligoflexia bacterium]
MSDSIKIRSIFVSDVGRRRTKNQDNGTALNDLGLCLVADGMGGHRGGETASQMVVDVFKELYSSSKGSTEERAKTTLRQAHEKIFKLSQEQASLHGMGTTTTCVALDLASTPAQAVVIHVGDSRCYFLQAGAIWQITRDHSLVQEKVRAGLIRRDQARHDAMKNVITRSVGFEALIQMDSYFVPVHPGDWFLLCSDGLTGHVDDREILMIADKHRATSATPDLEACGREMIALANERGGDDNISVGIMEIA